MHQALQVSLEHRFRSVCSQRSGCIGHALSIDAPRALAAVLSSLHHAHVRQGHTMPVAPRLGVLPPQRFLSCQIFLVVRRSYRYSSSVPSSIHRRALPRGQRLRMERARQPLHESWRGMLVTSGTQSCASSASGAPMPRLHRQGEGLSGWLSRTRLCHCDFVGRHITVTGCATRVSTRATPRTALSTRFSARCVSHPVIIALSFCRQCWRAHCVWDQDTNKCKEGDFGHHIGTDAIVLMAVLDLPLSAQGWRAS